MSIRRSASGCSTASYAIKESAKKVIFLVARPGGVGGIKAGSLRKMNLFLTKKAKLEGRGVRP